ncbi:DUF4091 domain-containing protein [Chitinophaga rhizophila]|uniref:DUF4091 domain-containing protein n=1 Tax=Chitinophaga rhizophila TaxID=2866212 RepID=A0ABS7GIE4_9BACT|nr:DUF4091 domain-containing protein [Chitinophaga rhizophila]MBW8686447.1 DUF4091 domain-containing protein [Chitinophaga rhizophila]
MKAFFLLLLGSLTLSGLQAQDASRKKGGETAIFVDPLIKVFKYSTDLKEVKPVADVARGENASFQFVYRSGKQIKSLSAKITSLKGERGGTISNGAVKFVGFVKQGRYAEHPGTDALKSKDGTFPDPLFEQESIAVKAGDNQSIWLTIPIADNQQADTYHGELLVTAVSADGNQQSYKKNFDITVYPVSVAKQTLWVSNWAAFLNPWSLPLKKPAATTMYSDEYWAALKKFADKLTEYRQNVIRIEMLKVITFTKGNNGRYDFNFDRLDKMMNIFMQSGIKRFEGDFVAQKVSDWAGPLGFMMPTDAGAAVSRKLVTVDKDDNNARQFYKEYLIALYNHLKEKKWDDIVFLHISDEPTQQNPKAYRDMLAFVKSVVPDMKTIEAINQPVPEDVDIQVPLLSYYRYGNSARFIKQQQQNKGEIWFYVCVSPQYNYPNRFLENPLIKTRFLHWANYKFNLTGFLHWGFNIWSGNAYDFSTSNSVGGDAWVVYPKDGKIISSIRLEAERDGIVDYELLRLLEKKNPSMAKQIIDATMMDFDKFNSDIDTFRANRRKILTALSK